MKFDLRVEAEDQKVFIYLHENEGDFLREIYLMSIEGLRCISYYNQLVGERVNYAANQIKLECTGHTLHAYYYLIISHWCKIFGSENSEPSHYLKLIKRKSISVALKQVGIALDKDNLKKELLKRANLNEEDFDKYRKDVLHYRNKYSTHKEYVENKSLIAGLTHPHTEIPRKTFMALSFILQDCALHLPKERKANDWVELQFYTIQNENVFNRIAIPSPHFY